VLMTALRMNCGDLVDSTAQALSHLKGPTGAEMYARLPQGLG